MDTTSSPSTSGRLAFIRVRRRPRRPEYPLYRARSQIAVKTDSLLLLQQGRQGAGKGQGIDSTDLGAIIVA